MNAITAILDASPDALARLRVRDHQQMSGDEFPARPGNMWDNRPSWDNWQKHK